MSHSVVIIDGAIDALKGNATSGDLSILKGYVATIDANLANLPTEAHELLENIETWFVSGYGSESVSDQMNVFINACKDYI